METIDDDSSQRSKNELDVISELDMIVEEEVKNSIDILNFYWKKIS